MSSSLRVKRVADQMQAEISSLLHTEMNDRRLTLVSVTRIIVDRELEHANVFVSTVGDDARREEVLRALGGAAGFIRREVSRRLTLRRTPELHFHWDPSPEKAEQVSQLLDQLRDEPKPEAPPAEETPPDE